MAIDFQFSFGLLHRSQRNKSAGSHTGKVSGVISSGFPQLGDLVGVYFCVDIFGPDRLEMERLHLIPVLFYPVTAAPCLDT